MIKSKESQMNTEDYFKGKWSYR